jgi:hypothetical protein
MPKTNETPALGRIRGSERCYRSYRLDCSDGTVSPQGISESLVWAREDSPFFDFADEDGQLMWTFPVCDEIAVIDCVAWRRERPELWWLRTAEALKTSPWLFRRAIDWNLPLHLVATPEEWVGDPCHRACILQPDKFDLAYELQRLPFIECSEKLEAYFRAEIQRRAIEKFNFRRPACRRCPNG